jgi:hypothetical protein
MTTLPAQTHADSGFGKLVGDFVKQHGPLGLSLAVVIYLLVWVSPSQQATQNAALEKQQEKFEAVIEKLTQSNHAVIEKMTESSRRENERLSQSLDRLREAIEGGNRK